MLLSEDVPGEMSDGAQILWAYRVIRRKSWGSSIARRVRRSRDMIEQLFPSISSSHVSGTARCYRRRGR